MWLILTILAGCGDKAPDAEPEADADADSDADADADTDSDSDADTDSDSDTDADTDADVEGDEDGDGWAPPEDCDDADEAVYPGRYEICSDGKDNDCDGLMDCEEGSCVEAELCAESECEDGEDNDGDGALDCEDGDCLGGPGCPATVQVLGGRLAVRDGSYGRSRWESHLDTHSLGWLTWEGERSFQHAWFDRLDAYSVSGVLRVDSGALSCLWYVDRAWSRFFFATTLTWPGTTMGYDGGSSSGRSGFRVSSACPLRETSIALPRLYGGGVAAGGDYGIRVGSPWATQWWYHGTQAVTATTDQSYRTSTSGASWRSGERSWYYAQTWFIEEILSGEEIALP